MRRIHKFLSVVLAIMMVWSIVPITAFAANAGTCGDNLTWVYNSSTYTLTISGTGNMKDFSYTNRPWETQEDKIKTVVINDGVTSIGAYAFYSFGKVTSITIPDSVTKIGITAFNACKLLTSIELPEGITSIPNRAFTNCTSLTSVTIPANVTTIGSSAFEGCSSLTSVVIPEGVTTIKDKAFASCTALTSITIPASVTSIDISAFENCTNLASLTIDSNNPNFSTDEFGVLFNKDKTTLIMYSMGSVSTSYTIPDSVKTIGKNAFKGQKTLTEIIIPESVTTIDSSAFEGCSSLTYVEIPESVTKIQDRAFASCIGLTSVSIPTSVTTIGINAFVGTALYDNAENWINGILYIGDCLIVANNSLTGVVQIKDGTRMIADEAFYGCAGITSLVFPEGITTISKDAFTHCSGLVNVTIPASIKEIRDGAFSDCSALQEVYYLGEARDWLKISFGNQNEPLTTAILLSGPGGEEIVIPGGFIGAVKWFYDEKTYVLNISGQGEMQDMESGNRPWEAYAQDIQTVVIENDVTTVGKYAFYNLDSLSSVILPYGLTTINSHAFGNCDALTDILLPKTLETICNNAFENNTSLANINLDGVKTIGSSAFYRCSNLANITLGDNLTSIGSSAFYGCTNLTNVAIGKGLQTIGNQAFDDCPLFESFTVNSENPNFSSNQDGVLFNKDITELIIYPAGNPRTNYQMPDTITVIKGNSFDGCNNLHTLVLSNNLRQIESSTFDNCSIKEFHYPGTIEKWEGDVKVGDQNYQLNSKTLKCTPTDLEAITSRCGDNLIWTLNAITGDMVIYGTGEMYDYSNDGKRPWEKYTSAILNVVVEDGVTKIGTYAFSNCTRIKSITLGKNVTTIGNRAFVSCTSLESLTLPNSVTTIGAAAFLGCEGIKNIIIGKGLETFEINTFGRCTALENITVDSENPNFSSDEFGVLFNKDKTLLVKYPEGNSRIKYIIPTSVTIIEANAFFASKNLTEVIMPDGVTLIGTSAFAECTNLKAIDIPASVTTMGEDVFYSCLKLEKVSLPDGINRIEARTFFCCESLTEIVIPASIISIGQESFYECISLKHIYFKGTRSQWTGMIVESNNQPINDAIIRFNYGEGDFSYTIVSEVKKTIRITSYNISKPSMRVIIPETIDGYTVVEIGDSAFSNFDSLVSVKIPDSVTNIGEKAFYDCDSITDITIPEGVTIIGENAFVSCDRLATVMMGKGVETIADGAFNGCNALKVVCYTGTEENWNSIAIGENNQPLINAAKYFEYGELDFVSGTCGEDLTWTLDFYSGKLTISGTGEMNEYGSSKYPWENYKGSIREVVISDGVTTIGNSAFKSCINLEKVAIAGSVTVISQSAFIYCSNLENVTINDGVERIANSAFSECESLKSIVIPDSVTSIENSAFYNCEALTTVKLSNNIKEINSSTFYYCRSLKEIIIPEGVIRIGANAFSSCISLTEVTIPESITKIADRAFEYCKGLESVTIGLSIKEIGYNVFYYCSKLKDVYYSGSQSQWTMVSIHSNNSELFAATLHCLGPEHPHEFVIEVTEPTCYDRGYTTYTCECGYSYMGDYVDELGHDFVGTVTSPTCTKEGYTTYKCSRCIESYVGAEPIPPTGHTFVSEITTHPTHLTEGVEKLTCKDCGYTNTKPVEKVAEHTYEAVVTVPTCTEQGYTTYNCACGDSYIGDYVPVSGHTIEQFECIITEPDCLNEGSKEVVSCCSVCNAGLGVEIVAIPAHGHAPAKAVEENYVAPTCTENGSQDTVIYCSVCNEEISRETDIIGSLGHADNDGDGYCDICDELLEIIEECDCDCHKPGISGFFWNIRMFISKIFGTNKMCECGIVHY